MLHNPLQRASHEKFLIFVYIFIFFCLFFCPKHILLCLSVSMTSSRPVLWGTEDARLRENSRGINWRCAICHLCRRSYTKVREERARREQLGSRGAVLLFLQEKCHRRDAGMHQNTTASQKWFWQLHVKVDRLLRWPEVTGYFGCSFVVADYWLWCRCAVVCVNLGNMPSIFYVFSFS